MSSMDVNQSSRMVAVNNSNETQTDESKEHTVKHQGREYKVIPTSFEGEAQGGGGGVGCAVICMIVGGAMWGAGAANNDPGLTVAGQIVFGIGAGACALTCCCVATIVCCAAAAN